MPASRVIEVADLKQGLSELGVPITIDASVADTDNALDLATKFADAFVIAQRIQNDFAPTGEDVNAIVRIDAPAEQQETYPGSGVFKNIANFTYRLSGRSVVEAVEVLGNYV